jgi:hypothetical protein
MTEGIDWASTVNLLEVVRSELKETHPVLAAMATELNCTTKQSDDGTLGLRITFDGPALPQKLRIECDRTRPKTSGEWQRTIDEWLQTCERDVAASMKSAGYGSRLDLLSGNKSG